MKKRLTSIFLAVVMVLSLCIPAVAAEAAPATIEGYYDFDGHVTVPYDETGKLAAAASRGFGIRIEDKDASRISDVNYDLIENAVFCYVGRLDPAKGNTNYWIEIGNGKTIIAAGWVVFEKHTINYETNPVDGSGGKFADTNPTEAYPGSTVNFTVEPKAGEGWYVKEVTMTANGEKTDLTGKNSFTMPACDVTVLATFEQTKPDEYTITIDDKIVNGTVSASAQKATAGTEITLTVTPGDGYELDTLTIAYDGKTETLNGTTFTMPAANVVVSATFEKPTAPDYSITVTNSKPEGGKVSVDKTTAKENDLVTITLEAEEGYELDTLTVTPASVKVEGTGDTRTFNMPADNVTVTATFKKTDYTVTVNNVTGGTVTADRTSATIGDPVTLTVAPAANYVLLELDARDADGNALTLEHEEGSNTYTFTMPASDVTVTPSWRFTGGGGGTIVAPAPTYDVNVPGEVDNGEISVSHTKASEGTTVTITVNPDEGYDLDTLVVTDANGRQLTLVSLGDGKYTFTMPASKVTVSVSFKQSYTGSNYAVCPKDETCPIWPFTDAFSNTWYHDGVHYCLEHGLMNGIGDNLFNPNGKTNRDMVAVVLWRLAGKPETDSALVFPDVPTVSWYTDAVRWATSTGVVKGYDDGLFGPGNAITREQMAAMLYRYAQFKGYDTSVRGNLEAFPDAAKVSDWALDAMSWANGTGLITGRDGMLEPYGNASRAEVATMVMRFCENVVK